MSASRIVLLTLFYLGLFVTSAFAQQVDPANLEFSKRTSDGRYSFIKFKKSGTKTDTSATRVKQLLGLGNRHTLLFDNNSKLPADLKDGQIRHSRYQQYFSGLKVEFSHLTLHSRSGALEILSGDYYTIPETFSTTPSLTESAALSQALSFVGATKYSWEQGNFPTKALNERPTGELVVCKDFIGERNNPLAPINMRLAYKFKIYAVQPLKYDAIYVDASDGRILLVDPIIKHADGIADTKYSGTRNISTSATTTGQFTLKDTSGNYNVATWNLNKATNYTNAAEFIDNDNNWSGQEYNNANFDNAALDAHWGALKTSEYFKLKHNRNSFDNNGSRINSYVHFGNNYVNAFWDGIGVTYGDGNGVSHYPLSTLDICGHEIAHAVCQYSAGLIYFSESGAINESLSDIWGACVEYFADPLKSTWLLGDECSTTGTPFRSMSNPNSQGQPDTYKGTFWYTGFEDNGGVHYNSGVMNFWFYVLSVGHSGVNDFGLAYSIPGIGIDKAAAIVYRAETYYMYPSSGYPDARIATLQATGDLYGVGSNEYLQVKNAWKAVGVTDILPSIQSFSANFVNSQAQMNWTYSSAVELAGFSVQRSVNNTENFQQIAFVGATDRAYVDNQFVNNANNYYRIRAVSADSAFSAYSASQKLVIGNAPFIMGSGNLTTCGVEFLDSGGTGNYKKNLFQTASFFPATAGAKSRVRFSQFRTSNSSDYLIVYSGEPYGDYMAGLSGKMGPMTFDSRAANGSLSFYFLSSTVSTGDSGWKAYISCFKPIVAVSGLTATISPEGYARLQWNDLVNDETKFVVERSLNDTIGFLPLKEVSANTTVFVDSTLPVQTEVYYRVVAYWDNIESLFSNSALAVSGNVIQMQNGSASTCDALFVDNGGFGNLQSTDGQSQTLVISPAEPSKKLKVLFTQFSISTVNDYLRVYDGPNTSFPLIGEYRGDNVPPLIEGSAPDGQLCFVYNGRSIYQPGWKANITCYTPVATPTDLAATLVGNTVEVRWTDNATDDTKYVVERSVNSKKRFLKLAELPANSTLFTDTSSINNALFTYRVRAFRNDQASKYSSSLEFAKGNAPFFMRDSVVITCDKIFMDAGGDDTLVYGDAQKTVTFKPSIPNNKIRVNFQFYRAIGNTLYVYNGASTSAPLIGEYTYYPILPVFEANNAEGALTFRFSTVSNVDLGWLASVTCFKPVSKPTELTTSVNGNQKVELQWTDNADDETKYIVERSTNAPSKFVQVAELQPNANSYTDTTSPNDALLYYRVRALRDTAVSPYSEPAFVAVGNAPFLMKDSTLIVCGKWFMDAGGEDLYAPDNYPRVVTFKPGIAGNKIRIEFQKFKTNANLQFFDGSVAYSSPSLGSFSGTTISKIIDATGPEGSITVVFQNTFASDSGWLAYVSCYKPVVRPTGLQSSQPSANKIRLQWADNSPEETGFVVERSVNASTLFTPIAQLSPNTISFVDSLAAVNSLLYYRVKAIRDTISSFYSDTSKVVFGNAPLIMTDTVAVVCGTQFMDPGGADLLPPNSRLYTATLLPNSPEHRVRVTFKMFKIGSNGMLRVLNGPSTNSPLLAEAYNGAGLPTSLEGLNSSGALTFYYYSSGQVDSGWLADVVCYKIVAKPTELVASYQAEQKPLVKWKDNANDETSYIVERSTNSRNSFTVIATVPQNSTSYRDTSAPYNSSLFYRVKAFRDTLGSFYSDTFELSYGNGPYIMTDTTIAICDRLFLDAGGYGNVPVFDRKTTTLMPGIPGHRVKVIFEKFQVDFGTLAVYNGSTINSPVIGTYNGPVQMPVFDGNGPDGSLTFLHYFGRPSDSGWVARVYCYKPVAKPVIGKALPHSSNHIRLNWKDNADDETKYVVERSVNCDTKFIALAELPSNSTEFIDTNTTVNAIVFYRVAAFRDTLKSFYSDTARFEQGNAPIIMNNGTVIGCDKEFMDSGGDDLMPLGSTAMVMTLRAPSPNQQIRLDFSAFKIGTTGTFIVYNGMSNYSSPVIGTFNDANKPSSIESSNEKGALTIYFQKNIGFTDSGWVAHLTCIDQVAKPTKLLAVKTVDAKVKLNWTDNSVDESAFIVERSEDGLNFQVHSELSANTTEFIDQNTGTAPRLYYRVAAKRLEQVSLPTETLTVLMAGDTIIMDNGKYSGCGFILMDPGGYGNYPLNTEKIVTFYPPDNQSKLKVDFRQFKFAQDFSDFIEIHDGNSTEAPIAVSGSSYYTPQTFTSTAPDGSLTFRFTSNNYAVDSGFIVDISCVRFPAPSNLRATIIGRNAVRLDWKKADTSLNSTYVERAIGSPVLFKEVNWTSTIGDTAMIDNQVPMNSVVYYRVRLSGYPRSSSFSNQVHVQTYSCVVNPDSITDISSSQYAYPVSQISILDSTCKLIAQIIPDVYNPEMGNVRISMKMYPASQSYLGQHFVKRHYELFAPLSYNSNATVKLYFTQQEFDTYNAVTNHSKLPTHRFDYAAYGNVSLYRFSGSSWDASLLPETYNSTFPVSISENAAVGLQWSNKYNCWELTAKVNGVQGFLLSSKSDTLNLCPINDPSATNFIWSNAMAYSVNYQWQKLEGNSWTNLSDGYEFSDTKTFALVAKNSFLGHGDQFRCIAGSNISQTYTINKTSYWIGNVSGDWNDSRNWRCGTVPHSNSAIVVEAGNSYYPFVVQNIICRKLDVKTGGSVTVVTGASIKVEK